MTTGNPRKRFVYVLAGWQERPATADRPTVWRFSLEDTQAGQRNGFGSLTQLMAFLELELGLQRSPQQSPEHGATRQRMNEQLDSTSST